MDSSNRYNNQEKQQSQKMLNKSLMIQKQEQSYSNDTLCRTLSMSESLIQKYTKSQNTPIFGYFDTFNCSKLKNEQELYQQLLFGIQAFKYSYEDYVKKYVKYDFPDNLSLDDIKYIIANWIKEFPKLETELNVLIGIFGNKTDFSYNDVIMNLSEDKSGVTNPDILRKYVPIVMNDVYQRGENVKIKYEKGDLDQSVPLNKNFQDSELSKLENNMINNEKSSYKTKKKEEKPDTGKYYI